MNVLRKFGGLRGFNSRAHTGRDEANILLGNRQQFQFTRPHGARRRSPGRTTPDAGFNSRAHTGRDPRVRDIRPARRVSIHAPTRGATEDFEWIKKEVAFQFTRPHGARHPANGIPRPGRVSIHAPTRGATGDMADADTPGRVSIHAPTRGATRRALIKRGVSGAVSIHAPTRGATNPWPS